MNGKRITILICVLLVIFGLSGCQSGKEAGEKLKISMTLMGGPKIQDSWLEAELEKELGVDFDFIMLPGWGEKKQKTNLMMSDLDTMPDVLWFHDMDKEFNQWLEAGLLVDMLPLLPKTPNREILKYYNEDVLFKCYQNGGLYKLPGDVPEPCCMTTIIRKDWLDNLGLEAPTTIEELIEVARAFTFKDPDGNGLDDTYGFGGGKNMRNTEEFRTFSPITYPFGLDWRHNYSWMITDDGIKNSSVLPESKQALKILRDMYAEGIMDPSTVTGNEWLDETFAKGKVGIFYRWITYFNPSQPQTMSFKANNPDGELLAIPAIKGKDGFSSDLPSDNGGWCFIAITKHAKDPQAVMNVLDRMMSPKIFALRKFGQEGLHYEIIDGQYKALVTPEEQNEAGINLTCWILERKDAANLVNTPEVTKMFEDAIATSRPMFDKFAWFKDQNRPKRIEYYSDICDIMDETFYGIIAGTKPLSAWDDYVKQYYQMGGKEIDEENAVYYERLMKDRQEFSRVYAEKLK